MKKAYFAGGCFWGVEYYFQEEPGVISTRVGYMGGHVEYPNYEEVCSKSTGHTEVVEIVFDEKVTSFISLAKLFFEIHDPGQLNRQGPDIGDQYRSEIFYTSDEQRQVSMDLISELKEKGHAVVTQLSRAETFWNAENYHQQYYQKNGHQPYCHFRKRKFD